MGIRLAMASIPKEGKVQNALRIQRAALLCMSLKTLNGYDSSILL